MTKYDQYVYCPTRTHSPSPRFVSRDSLPSTGYRSVYAVTQADAGAITEAQTTAGYRGSVWNDRVVIDIDDYSKAEAVESRLRRSGLDFLAYDSGGKGAHFEVLRDHGPSHQLPAKDKQWVMSNVPEADRTIYTHLHLYRLPGHVHETTGRRKELVSVSKGKALTLPPLERRDVGRLTSPTPTGGMASGAGFASMFASFRVMSCLRAVPVGYRHENLVKLVYALKDDAGVDPSLAYTIALHVNMLYDEPKDDEAVGQIVTSIYREAA